MRKGMALIMIVLIQLAAVAAAHGLDDKPGHPTGQVAPADSSALRLARAYLAACDRADRNALDALFLTNGRATVLENASDEGAWEQYRDDHLMPELKEMKGIAFTLETEAEQKFGATSIVRQTGWFMVPDLADEDRPRKILAAVTYVIVEDAGSPKIVHLHWSSRAAKKPATQPAQAGEGSAKEHRHNSN